MHLDRIDNFFPDPHEVKPMKKADLVGDGNSEQGDFQTGKKKKKPEENQKKKSSDSSGNLGNNLDVTG
jgi:hypothetical protein